MKNASHFECQALVSVPFIGSTFLFNCFISVFYKSVIARKNFLFFIKLNFNVLETALETLCFVQALPRTTLLCCLQYFKADFQIGFTQIAQVNEECLQQTSPHNLDTIEAIVESDNAARRLSLNIIGSLSQSSMKRAAS